LTNKDVYNQILGVWWYTTKCSLQPDRIHYAA